MLLIITSEYYYSYGDVYKVTFSSDGTGGYNITVSSLPEDTTSCGAGAGAGARNFPIFRSLAHVMPLIIYQPIA